MREKDQPERGHDRRRLVTLMAEIARSRSIEEVMPHLLDAALELSGAQWGWIYRLEGENLFLRHARNLPPRFAEAVGVLPLAAPVVQEALRRPEPVDGMDLSEETTQVMRAHGLTEAWTVHLRADDQLVGFISVGSNQATPLDREGLELLPILGLEMASLLGRLRSEESLRRTERSYREVFDAVNDALFIRDAATSRVLDVNRAMLEMFECTREEALNLLPGDSSEGTAPFDAEEAAARMRRAVEEGPQVFEWSAKKHGTGVTFPVEVSLRSADIGGQLQILSVVRDITERKRAEEQERKGQERLRAAEAEKRLILESLPTHVVVLERAGVIEYINHTPPGFDRESVLGVAATELIDAESHEAFRRCLDQAAETGETAEAEVVDINGRSFLNRITRLRGEGASASLLSVATDITDRKREEREHRRLAAKLKNSEKLESLAVLAGGIAHDFNNLLTGILASTSLILDDLPAGSMAREAVGEIEQAGKEASELVRQLLAYAGKETMLVERYDLGQLVRETTRVMASSISRMAVLQVEVGREALPVEADLTQLRQVLWHLVTNASEALEDRSGRIIVSTGIVRRPIAAQVVASTPSPSAMEAWAYVEVADTGAGMDAETVERIHDPFFSTKFLGRGLGMAAVLGIVRRHDGSVEVESEPNRGTKIRVLLPLLEVVEGELPAEPSAPGLVLLVDDEEPIRKLGRRMLQRLGYEASVVSDGPAALNAFAATPDRFTCVLLDLDMPGPTGEDVLRDIRRLRPDVPVIICSGYDEKDLADRFGSDQPSAFLIKPFNLTSLQRTLEEVGAGAPER